MSKGDFSTEIDELTEAIAEVYQSNDVPWVIGYSGGKDSTAVAQLIWMALQRVPEEARTKEVHVITTDTLVENPIVATWVSESLKKIEKRANEVGLPVRSHLLTPAVENSFWVNLIGKGYPAPRRGFRWCTERLKIKPSNTFIRETVSEAGEVILALGVRRAESAVRAARIDRRREKTDGWLRPHDDLENCQTFTPIEDWSNDEVWKFLLQYKNPWGGKNQDLMTLYRGATADNECPIVVDTSTPSCGNSRFGCWVCTLVDEDKSMSAMIQNDHEKEWMLPLLEFRNSLDFRSEAARRRDRERRDFRRMNGQLTFYKDKEGKPHVTPGPYTQGARAEFLRRLLTVQRTIQENPNSPEVARTLELITLDELREIRRIWLNEKNEAEDLLPGIYEEVLDCAYPDDRADDSRVFGTADFEQLRACSSDESAYQCAREVLEIERDALLKKHRHGVLKRIESALDRYSIRTKEQALEQQLKRTDSEYRAKARLDRVMSLMEEA